MESSSVKPTSEAPPHLKRASLMAPGNIKRYTGGHVYIFDDVARGPINYNPIIRGDDVVHENACDRIDAFFRQNTPYTVHNIRKTQVGYKQKQFFKWWRDELAGHSADEFIIVYFHGSAYGRGIEFTWQFRSLPSEHNAWRLFEITNASTSDCLFILDCFVATRFLEVPRRTQGHSDYTIAGQRAPDEHGHFKHTNGYTTQLTEYLTFFKKNISSVFVNWHARKSLPELLHRNPDLTSNPLRLWASKTGGYGYVYRFYVEPDDVRANGNLEWVRVCIQENHREIDSEKATYDEHELIQLDDEDEEGTHEGALDTGEASVDPQSVYQRVQQATSDLTNRQPEHSGPARPSGDQPHPTIEVKVELPIDFVIQATDNIIDLTGDADVEQDQNATVPRSMITIVDLTGDDGDVIMTFDSATCKREDDGESVFIPATH